MEESEKDGQFCVHVLSKEIWKCAVVDEMRKVLKIFSVEYFQPIRIGIRRIISLMNSAHHDIVPLCQPNN